MGSEEKVEEALKQLVRLGRLKPGANVVVVSSIQSGEQLVDTIQMRVAK
jgi:hypothetical protein